MSTRSDNSAAELPSTLVLHPVEVLAFSEIEAESSHLRLCDAIQIFKIVPMSIHLEVLPPSGQSRVNIPDPAPSGSKCLILTVPSGITTPVHLSRGSLPQPAKIRPV